MDYDTFIGQVQNRAELDSREDALQVTRITLEHLSRRIQPTAAENLAGQLPDEIGRHLEKIEQVESHEWDEFVSRMLEAGRYNRDDDEGDAVHHARVVVDVVDDAVEDSVLFDIRDQFPPDGDWDELFWLADGDIRSVPPEQRPG